FLKHKSDVLEQYKQWKKDVQIFFHSEVHEEHFSVLYTEFICSNDGREYTESKLLKYFWVDAMLPATYVTGCSPAAGIKGKTLYEMLFNQNVDPSFFCPFGCPTYALIPKNNAGRVPPKGCKAIMIDYMHGQKVYKLMDLAQHTVFSSRYITFNETNQISDADLAPWHVHPARQQWEGLFSLQCHCPNTSVSDEEN
ncbi:hypothetical protein BDR04DRAFT_974678, partial [Suillus decipiens]